MTDLSDVKKFLYSQQAYSGFRMALGTILPGVVLVVFFDRPVQGISCALGAFCICLVDVPAPLWRKHRHMLLGTLVIATVSALTIFALPYGFALWIVLLGVCFIAGVAASSGQLATAMGVAAMLSVAMMLSQRHAGLDLWSYLTWLVTGGLWYTYFCLSMCQIFKLQMARRSLADCMFATADYLNARSQCYTPAVELKKCYEDMIRTQVVVVDAQQEARSLVLANMFVGRRLANEPQRIRLFNILTDIIDMHDSVLAMQVNFETLRKEFSQADVNDFMRDLLQKTAAELTRVARAVVTGLPQLHHFSVKAELRALEYEVQLAKGTAIEPALALAHGRGKAIAAMMEKLMQDLSSTENTSDISMDAIEKRYFQPPPAWTGFQWTSPGLRYALRLTIAIAFGMTLSEIIGGHSIWIVVTIMVVLRPGFGLTQQRNKYRLIGTLLGCIAVQAVLWTVTQPSTLFWIMAGSFLLVFSLMRLNYLMSVFFATLAILLVYHFMSPQLALVGQRAIDTMVGTLIGAVAGYMFPSWEYQLMAPQIGAALKNCRRYAERVFATSLEPIEYKLARRDALVALTALTASYQRMLQEPLAKQRQAQEVGELVMQCNILVSEIATLAHIRTADRSLSEIPVFAATGKVVQDALSAMAVTPVDDEMIGSQDVLSSMQKSAINISRLSLVLTLPGMNKTLKSVQSRKLQNLDL